MVSSSATRRATVLCLLTVSFSQGEQLLDAVPRVGSLAFRQDALLYPIYAFGGEVARRINLLRLEIMAQGGAGLVSFLQGLRGSQRADEIGRLRCEVRAELVELAVIGEFARGFFHALPRAGIVVLAPHFLRSEDRR